MKPITDAAIDRYYQLAEFCSCEEPCESDDAHREKAEAAYERWADQEYDRRREDRNV